MIVFKMFPACEVQEGTHVQSLRRRVTVAMMTLFATASIVALAPVNDISSPPSSSLFLACANTPGACPNPS